VRAILLEAVEKRFGAVEVVPSIVSFKTRRNNGRR
jgi:hypothetical protein